MIEIHVPFEDAMVGRYRYVGIGKDMTIYVQLVCLVGRVCWLVNNVCCLEWKFGGMRCMYVLEVEWSRVE